jgi:hypothetical protein
MKDIIKYEIIPYMDFYSLFSLRINHDINNHILNLIKNNEKWRKLFTEIFSSHFLYQQKYKDILCLKYMNIFIDYSYMGGFKFYGAQDWGLNNIDFSLFNFNELRTMLYDAHINERLINKNIKYFVKYEKIKLEILEMREIYSRNLIKYYSEPKYLNILINNNKNVNKYRYSDDIEIYLNYMFHHIDSKEYIHIIHIFTLSENFIRRIINNTNEFLICANILTKQCVSHNFVNKYLIPKFNSYCKKIIKLCIKYQNYDEEYVYQNIDNILDIIDIADICNNKLSEKFVIKYLDQFFQYPNRKLIVDKLIENSYLSFNFMEKYFNIEKMEFTKNIKNIIDNIKIDYNVVQDYLISYKSFFSNENWKYYQKRILLSRKKVPEEFIEEYLPTICFESDLTELFLSKPFLSKQFILKHIDKLPSLRVLRTNMMSFKDFEEIKDAYIANNIIIYNKKSENNNY